MRTSALLPALAAVTALVLAGCGSNDDTTTTAGNGAPETGSCPTAAPAADAKPDWTFTGSTGEIKVVAPTTTTAPGVTVQTPFAVAATKVETLTPGTGDQVITLEDMVSVCYVGVNGRDGKVFDSAYERGTPTPFPLTNVVSGFQKAIVGQKPGATVAVAMTPDDGYRPMGGQADAGILADDALIFVLQIKGIEQTDGSE
ncbi:FKBP-type peptidyl-prolyl cis-trans isomerase [Gordonia crocea]|uniref:Peptidyl-prolyl cis-trans isomerase n=1 Tax=Gordonia crocea TaxID=589162 RepID=A0A7I9UZJ5_9ACTN|nr:FKBP-type peptidyl-prolyl cis-trans isomerase [Gordonia crocea]GED98545.1 peptidyl-prolyl cis-trans isomerase [Gordonia crocea]